MTSKQIVQKARARGRCIGCGKPVGENGRCVDPHCTCYDPDGPLEATKPGRPPKPSKERVDHSRAC